MIILTGAGAVAGSRTWAEIAAGAGVCDGGGARTGARLGQG